MLSNRANAICVLEILKEYSDADHILQMQDIIAKMKNVYAMDVDRRTVYSAIDLLKTLGYDISDYNDNGVGYYLVDRPLEVSEVRLLMDSVYANQAISVQQTEQLVEKLQRLLNAHDRKIYKSLRAIKTNKKSINQETFLNIEVLDDAIEQNKKVQFTYLDYDFDKTLKPRREKKYTVNPYQLICTNEHYYLVSKSYPTSKIILFRIDMMRDVSISKYNIDAPLTEAELQTAKDKTIYAWYSEPETVSIRCQNFVLREVIDRFGQDVRIERENDDMFLATVKMAPYGILFWALQYLPYVEVLTPKWLRDEVIGSINRNPYSEVMCNDNSNGNSD